MVLGALLFCLWSATANAQSRTERVAFETVSAGKLANAVDLGPVPASQRFTVTLTLAPTAEREASLDQFLADIANGSSPSYRKWVTPAEFASRFGATPDQISAATEWAQTQGLSIVSISPSNARMVVSGVSAQFETTFAVSLHQVRVGANTFYSNLQSPTLPASTAALFSAVEGLDNLPADTVSALAGSTANPATSVNGNPSALSVAALSPLIDQNAISMLTLDATAGVGTVSPSQLAGYTALFRQAAAQGITVLLTRASSSGGFPSDLAEITAVARPDDAPDTEVSSVARPFWQSAPGLPDDSFRHAPDLTATSVSALAATLSSIATSIPGGRMGNINPILYRLAPTPDLYTQSDSVAAGTWDAASGLGLVNLDKLAKAFPKGVGGSYTSFSSSNYAPTHGQSITLTSTVTSGTGGSTPTGTVAFATSSGTTIATVNLDTNGNATYTTNQLAGGSSTLQANYSGDTNYAPSSSPTGTVFVQPEASALSVNVSTGNVYGSSYTVTVTDSAASGVGQPTGNITLTVQGPGTMYTQALTASGPNSSVTSFTLPATTVGTQTLSISCTTSASFSCYNPYTTTVSVDKATPRVSLSYTPNPPQSGTSISLTSTVTGVSGAAMPTGNVVFYDNATTLNAGALSSGTATATGTVPSTTTHSISASYGGDPNYNGATVVGATTSSTATLTATPSMTSAAPGSTITIATTVTIAGATSAPTGTVQATVGTTSASGTLAATSTTTSAGSISLTVPAAGTYQVQVGCSGTDSFTCNTVSFSLTSTTSRSVPSTIAVTSSSYSVAYGTPFTLTGEVQSAASATTSTPTGSVTFSSAGLGVLGTATLSSGVANLPVSTAPPAGSYTFTGAYSGDTTFAGSTATSSTVTVTPVASVITASINPSTVGSGTSTTVAATVTLPGSTVAPAGTVTVTVPGVTGAVYSGTLVATGTNTASVNINLPAPPSGTYQLVVQCASTANYTCSPTTVSLTSTAAAKTSTTTALAASSYTVAAGQTVTLTAAVTPSSVVGGSQPTGTVTFVAAAQGVVGTATVSGGVATLTITPTAGTYSITANYSGDVTYGSSAGTAPSSIVVGSAKIATTTTLAISPTAPLAGQLVTLTATITPASVGASALSGSVLFYSGTTQIATGVVSGGTAVATFTPTGTTALSLTAVYSGDTNYAASSSAPVVVSPALTPVTIILTAVPTTGIAGTTIDFTVQVDGVVASGASPTGKVSFYLAGTAPVLLGTATLNSVNAGASVASFVASNLPSGAQSVYAVYAGDTVFASGVSNSIPIGLYDYALAFTPASITLAPGQSGTVVVQLNATAGFVGNIVLGCTPPPDALITCSLSQTALTGSGTSNLTINTTAGTQFKAANTLSLKALGGVSLAALLCLILPGRKRRRLPSMLLVLLAICLTTGIGCSTSTVTTNPISGGTPLGTVNLTLTTSATNGTISIAHDYSYQITIQ